MKKIFLAAAVLFVFSSCSNYYKAITASTPPSAANIEDLSMKKKYFILRNGNGEFAMKDISLTADQSAIQCTLENLPDEHKLHLTKGERGKMIYRNATSQIDETVVLNEVHVYIFPDAGIVPGNYTIALNQVQKIEVIEKDKEKTKKSHLIGGIGIPLGTILVVGGIAAVAASSSLSYWH